jgi:UPF0755 protein
MLKFRFLPHLLLLLATFAAFVFAASEWLGMYATQPGPAQEQVSVIIAPGTPGTRVVEQLTDAGAIRYPLAFRALATLQGHAPRLQAGEYAFPPKSTPMTILEMLTRGMVVVRQVTIPEGWTSQQVADAVNAADGLTGEPVPTPPEGHLLPDTYRYQRGETRAALVARMRKAMDDFLKEAWKTRADSSMVHDEKELLTLAAIVEKETGVPEERGTVASVYTNRLRIGMRLQADPTVAYGLTMGKEKLPRALSRADLQTPNPYNTYLNAGLPPGPICNPGRESILAVLNPPTTQYIYFVATGNGGHRFASTLDEHNRNVAAYRAALRKQQ